MFSEVSAFSVRPAPETPPKVIGALTMMPLAAFSVSVVPADPESGAATMMLPGSVPGLPAAQVEIVTLLFASWVCSVVALMVDVPVGVNAPPEKPPFPSSPVIVMS